jgi:hypothetical protein
MVLTRLRRSRWLALWALLAAFSFAAIPAAAVAHLVSQHGKTVDFKDDAGDTPTHQVVCKLCIGLSAAGSAAVSSFHAVFLCSSLASLPCTVDPTGAMTPVATPYLSRAPPSLIA